MTNFHYLFKYIIVGDSCNILDIYKLLVVGKSNILLQFSQKKFKSDHEITIGVEFGAKNISVGDDKVYRIQIWDTVNYKYFKKFRQDKKHSNQLPELTIKTASALFSSMTLLKKKVLIIFPHGLKSAKSSHLRRF
jgi:hypothetical protein